MSGITVPIGNIRPAGDRVCRIVGVLNGDNPDIAGGAPFSAAVETTTGALRLEVTEDAARRLRELLDDYLALRDLPRLRKHR